MASGETLLKLSDYPFAYSLVGLLTVVFGFSLIQHHAIYLGLAGALGTLLTIIDPFGWLVKKNIRQKLADSSDPDIRLITYEKEYAIQAINTKAVGVEIDKIVGILYFASTVTIFSYAMIFSSEFIKNFVIPDKNGSIVCNYLCIQTVGFSSSIVIFVLLMIFVIMRWKELFDKIITAGIHQLAISNEYPTINSVENMTRAVDQNDWETAKKWGNKILEEITYKKGKREIILRAGERIYRQLHREAQKIINDFNSMGINHTYSEAQASLWTDIKLDADDVIIEDEILRNEIVSFYDNVYQYNAILWTIRSIVFNIIKKRASEIYGLNIVNIYCNVNTGGGGGQADLANCAMYGIHPKNYAGIGTITSIEITYSDGKGNHSDNIQDAKRIGEFDKIWGLVIQDVDVEQNVIKFKKLVTDICAQAPTLAQKYREKIALEWKV